MAELAPSSQTAVRSCRRRLQQVQLQMASALEALVVEAVAVVVVVPVGAETVTASETAECWMDCSPCLVVAAAVWAQPCERQWVVAV